MEETSGTIKIVCPSAEELSVIVNNVRCDECGLSFRNEPRLRMHVLKIHERRNLEKTVKEKVRYHCPEILCVYSAKSERYFTTMKYVKQEKVRYHCPEILCVYSAKSERYFTTMKYVKQEKVRYHCPEILCVYSAKSERYFTTMKYVKQEKVRYHCPEILCVYSAKSERYFTTMKYVKQEKVRYHCPEILCVYSAKSERYFTTMKYVKQHYLKVHAAKTFGCNLCDKSFSTDAARHAHSRVCGIQFTCSCLRVFGTYEALLTHGKRMAHAIDEKYKSTLIRRVRAKTPPVAHHHRGSRPISILPQRTVSPSAPKTGLDVAVQTDDIKRQKRTPSPSKSWRRRESRQTQTSSLSSRERRQRKTVETQTSLAAAKSSVRKLVKKPLRNASRTEAFVKELGFAESYGNEHLFPGSPLQLQHDVGLQDLWEEKDTATQTSPEKDLLLALNESVSEPQTELGCCLAALTYVVGASAEAGCPFGADAVSRSDPMLTVQAFPDRFSSIETQTETAYPGYSFDSDVALGRGFAVSSNNETQTTENFDNIEQLLYSNTCTQTCNDILPSDLGLSDIQTQTAWPELDSAVPAETQTAPPSPCRAWLNTRTSHTETQTELLSMFDEFQ